MPVEVRVDVERFLGVVEAVLEDACPEGEGTGVMLGQGGGVGQEEVEVQLLGPFRPGPGRGRQGLHLLEGEVGSARRVLQDQPVPGRGIVRALGWRLRSRGGR